MLPRRHLTKSRRGSDVSAKRAASPLSRRMPAGRDHPRGHARRGRSDRRRDLRRRHPDHRGAAQLARPADEHRAAGGEVRRSGAGRRRHGAQADDVGRGPRCRRPDHRLARHQRRRDLAPAAAAGLVSCPGYFTPSEAFAAIRAGAHRAQAVPGRGRHARRCSRRSSRSSRATCRSSPSAGSSPTTCGRGSTPARPGFGLGGGLYKPGQSPDETLAKARAYVAG